MLLFEELSDHRDDALGPAGVVRGEGDRNVEEVVEGLGGVVAPVVLAADFGEELAAEVVCDDAVLVAQVVREPVVRLS